MKILIPITIIVVAAVGVAYWYFLGPEVSGYIIIGHEARSFQPCGSDIAMWLMGDQKTFAEIKSAYEKATAGNRPYYPVFGVLKGKITEPLKEGFGADYEKSFSAHKFVSIDPDLRCPKDTPLGRNPLNSGYIIDGQLFNLYDGKAEKAVAPGSASKILVNVFDADVKGDINGDGLEDGAVLLSYNSGGSGTFYYVAAAINGKEGYKGSNAIFIGDRIAPQIMEIKDGRLIVNYADRYPWESFTDRPSVGKSKYLKYEEGQLKEVPGEILSDETARALAIEKWGNCVKMECTNLDANVLDGKDGVWYVEAIYTGIRNDLVKARKLAASAHFADGKWRPGSELLNLQQCQSGMGHSDFSIQPCENPASQATTTQATSTSPANPVKPGKFPF